MITEKLSVLNFDNIGTIPTSAIPFAPSLLELCKMNQCGNYGKSYTCPPNVGIVDELIDKVKNFKYITLFQKIYKLEDSFDFEGMTNGKNDFKAMVRKVVEMFGDYPDDYLILGAGPCDLCPLCGIADGVPCRFPQKAIASLESYAIEVSTLAGLCSMNYINGANTVTYFGGIIHNHDE